MKQEILSKYTVPSLTMQLCSSDARSKGQSSDSLGREGVMVQRRKQKALRWMRTAEDQ
jgi:hypothetical protein